MPNRSPVCKIAGPRRQQDLLQGPFHIWTGASDIEVLVEFYRLDDGYLVRYPGVADMMISMDGRNCTAHPVSLTMREQTDHFFAAHIRPMMMELGGWEVYHGSSVDTGSGTVAFLGDSGLGKSTLAASFSQNGYNFLSDDFICLQLNPDGGYVQTPVEPSLRLKPESIAALVDETSPTLCQAPPLFGKSRFYPSADFTFCAEARPLKAAFFLVDDGVQTVQIEPFLGAQAYVHWVTASFMLDVADETALSRQFQQVTRLIKEIPCYTLDYPRDFARLGEVRQAVLRQVADIAQFGTARSAAPDTSVGC